MATAISEPHEPDAGNLDGDAGGSGSAGVSILNTGSEPFGNEHPLDGDDIDPSSIGAADSDGGEYAHIPAPFGRFADGKPRKRRPKGSGAGNANVSRSGGSTARVTASKTTFSINNILLSAHAMMAAFLSVPQLELDAEEAKSLADAVTNVTQMYDKEIVSPETYAWVNLAMIAGGIYGPRFVSYRLDRKSKGPRKVVAPQQPRVNMGVAEMPFRTDAAVM